MSEPKSFAEKLDSARNGHEFGAVIQDLFRTLEKQMEQGDE